MSVDWSYFDRFEQVIDKYMPARGEGDTMASQIATAVNKLVYKWYNDGDVYDNTCGLVGWLNDLSSYANWLDQNCGYRCSDILRGVYDVTTDGEYENLLKELADLMLDKDVLAYYASCPAVGSIYDCDGDYEFVDRAEEDDGYDRWEVESSRDDWDEEE